MLRRVRWSGLVLALALAAPGRGRAAEPSADEIVKAADDVMDPGDCTAEVEMRVRRKGEDDRVYRMTMEASGETKMLVSFVYPPRDKGEVFLRNQEDMWMYLPGVNKALRIPKRQAFAGSDFSNNDVLNVRVATDYRAERLPDEVVEGVPCYSLQLTGRDSSAPYASVRYWVAKETFWPVKRVFYAVSGQPFKTLILKGPAGAPRPDTSVMSNILEVDRITEMHVTHVQRAKHDAGIFTEAYLTRRR